MKDKQLIYKQKIKTQIIQKEKRKIKQGKNAKKLKLGILDHLQRLNAQDMKSYIILPKINE